MRPCTLGFSTYSRTLGALPEMAKVPELIPGTSGRTALPRGCLSLCIYACFVCIMPTNTKPSSFSQVLWTYPYTGFRLVLRSAGTSIVRTLLFNPMGDPLRRGPAGSVAGLRVSLRPPHRVTARQGAPHSDSDLTGEAPGTGVRAPLQLQMLRQLVQTNREQSQRIRLLAGQLGLEVSDDESELEGIEDEQSIEAADPNPGGGQRSYAAIVAQPTEKELARYRKAPNPSFAKYAGKEDSYTLENFQANFTLYFAQHGLQANSLERFRMMKVLSHLDGQAHLTARNSQIFAAVQTEECPYILQDLYDVLTAQFKPLPAKQQLYNQLRNLKQGNATMQSFVTKFLNIADQLENYDQAYLCLDFLGALSDAERVKGLGEKAATGVLRDVTDHAILLEAIDAKSQSAGAHTPRNQQQPHKPNTQARGAQHGNGSQQSPAPGKGKVLQQGHKGKTWGRQRRMNQAMNGSSDNKRKGPRCYHCGEYGHKKPDCPNLDKKLARLADQQPDVDNDGNLTALQAQPDHMWKVVRPKKKVKTA